MGPQTREPALIMQPAAPWVAPKEFIEFQGYDPNPGLFNKTSTVIVSPADNARIAASQAFTLKP